MLVQQPTRVPFYKPDIYPTILQKNVSVYGKFLGDSDIDKIKDQQNTTNVIERTIIEKLIKKIKGQSSAHKMKVDVEGKGEIGELHGVRFVESNEAKIWKDGETAVYATLFLGKDAFGILEPEGEGMEMIIKSKEQIGGPLNQFSTIGYKFNHGAKILYQERMLRVESGSALGADDTEN